ncbi:MAG: CPBP family intramembrane glutamate endopeptidase, partial [Cyanobium sp.]
MSPPPSGPSPASGPAPEPGWKVLLALLSLALTALLWFEGLAGSVEQPSVSNDLTLHQLELAALVEGRLSEPLAGLLLGDDPRRKLATALETRISSASPPAPIAQRLELALLNRGSAESQADPALASLVPMVEAARRPLLEALLDGQRRPQDQQQALLLPWKPG